MKLLTVLQKMQTKLAEPIEYYLDASFLANKALNKKISINYLGKINCVHCQRVIKKSFNNGYCFPCFKRLAQCDICIVKPELCHYHLGTCREPQWGLKHCMQSHIIYLANSSGLKVGITRAVNLPTRWIDQGAVSGLPIIRVNSRLEAGLIEVQLAKLVDDKTNWRKMLQHKISAIDLQQQRDLLLTKLILPENALTMDVACTELVYPILKIPEKINSINLDKQPLVEGVLYGIKGQYLILSTGVLNIRKYSGYNVELNIY